MSVMHTVAFSHWGPLPPPPRRSAARWYIHRDQVQQRWTLLQRFIWVPSHPHSPWQNGLWDGGAFSLGRYVNTPWPHAIPLIHSLYRQAFWQGCFLQWGSEQAPPETVCGFPISQILAEGIYNWNICGVTCSIQHSTQFKALIFPQE